MVNTNVRFGMGALFKNPQGQTDNTAVGYNAAYNNAETSIKSNLAVGAFALESNVSGEYNTGLGAEALKINTASLNTAVGFQSMKQNLSGKENVAVGVNSLQGTNVGDQNVALGAYTGGGGNNNVGVGFESMMNTTGNFNTAVGHSSLHENVVGTFNTAIGYRSLYANNTGPANTAIGGESLLSNTTGQFNVAVGAYSLRTNETATKNTAVGCQSLLNNIGEFNTAVGNDSLKSNMSGTENVAVGDSSLSRTQTGNYNTAIGVKSMGEIPTCISNVAMGYNSLYGAYNSNVENNVAIGVDSLKLATTSNNNVAIGHNTLSKTTNSVDNVAIGANSLSTHAGSSQNVAVGKDSLSQLISGTLNTALGYNSGANVTNSSYNTFLGTNTTATSGNYQYSTAVGYGAKITATNQIKLGADTVEKVVTAADVFATSFVATSDYRIKENVVTLDESYTVDGLRPVTYINKINGKRDIGVIAHELQTFYPELVNGTKDGEEKQSVNYLGLIGVLINEVQLLKKRVKKIELDREAKGK